MSLQEKLQKLQEFANFMYKNTTKVEVLLLGEKKG